MLQARRFRLSSIQVTYFTPNLGIQPQRALAYLLQRWGEEFDGEPLSFPLPPDAPAQIPNIILSSRDQRAKLEVSRARTNMLWTRTAEQDDVDIRTQTARSREVLEDFFGYMRSRPGRLAEVIVRYLPLERPGQVLAEHFCRDHWLEGPLQNPANFELHAHRRYTVFDDVVINNWLRAKTGIVTVGRRRSVIVEQDLNTLGEELGSREFTSDQTQAFFAAVIDEFDNSLGSFFP